MPIHGFSLDNVLGAADLSHHHDDNGIVSIGSSSGALATRERNGLVYTCREGFVDTAHLRDYADWVLFFTVWAAASADAYNISVDRWRSEVLERLGAVDAESGVAIAHSLDGYCWDATRRRPDPPGRVQSRNMEIGPIMEPWTAADAGSPVADRLLARACRDAAPKIAFGNPWSLGSIDLSERVRLEIEVDPGIEGFPLRPGLDRTVTDRNFFAIVERIRTAARSEFGAAADRPGRSLPSIESSIDRASETP